jgi:phosphinothricin acetyltransferase
MEIRPANADTDSEQLASIYNNYIESSHATFETDIIEASEMFSRLTRALEQGYPFLVAVSGEEIRGYAYGSQYRPRAAYRYSIETSVYVRADCFDRGVGTALYKVLLPAIAERGFHAILAGISLPNAPSIKLHEKFGFEKAAHFREVGFKFGRWIDVGYWEKLLIVAGE